MITHEVGVLRPHLNGSLWSFVEAIPEARRAFDYIASIRRAIGGIAGQEPAGRNWEPAASWIPGTGSVKQPKLLAVGEPYPTVLHGGVELIMPSNELTACVEVDIELRSMKLERPQALSALQQERACHSD